MLTRDLLPWLLPTQKVWHMHFLCSLGKVELAHLVQSDLMLSCIYNGTVTGLEPKEEAKKVGDAGVRAGVYTYTPRDVILYALGGRCDLDIIPVIMVYCLFSSWSLPLTD